MRLRDLTEAIPQPPRSIHYFAKCLEHAQSVAAVMERVGPLFKPLDDDSYMRGKVAQVFHDHFNIPFNDINGLLSAPQHMLGEYSSVGPKRLIQALESFMRFGTDPNNGSKFMSYVYDAARDLSSSMKEDWIGRIASVLPRDVNVIKQAFMSRDIASLLDPEWYGEEEIQHVQAFLEGLELFIPAITKFVWLAGDMKKKMDAHFERLSRMRQTEHDGKERHPPRGEVENLYHATAFATEITREGFKAELPQERYGIGAMGIEENLISFTHDLRIAWEIARCLKEIVMVANQKLKASTILGWLRQANIKDKDIYQYVGSLEFAKFDIYQTAKLYNYFLWVARGNIRQNPVFVNLEHLVERLVGRSEKDVGVLQCEVALDPSHQYLDSMNEFRVPPSAIRSVKRVL